MNIINFEFKVRVEELDKLEQKLLQLNPVFKGEDHQTDTYFNVNKGRLKLREGNIENALIYYEREDLPGSRKSEVILYKHSPDLALKNILVRTLGIKIIVDKKRKIYFIDNVKFHFDTVKDLGTFIEVEAIDEYGKTGIEELKKQCSEYADFFEFKQKHYIDKSYSDLLLEKTNADV